MLGTSKEGMMLGSSTRRLLQPTRHTTSKEDMMLGTSKEGMMLGSSTRRLVQSTMATPLSSSSTTRATLVQSTRPIISSSSSTTRPTISKEATAAPTSATPAPSRHGMAVHTL
ncbi:hypothetical protein LTR56_014398 [Elasticomyces elasticus]|nr:hypothetical protein LTR56_014398 [Elasticomyces elasticus]KAK4916665.1 hypothetical protein LTR49_015363 [Elasticomyces elasticus]